MRSTAPIICFVAAIALASGGIVSAQQVSKSNDARVVAGGSGREDGAARTAEPELEIQLRPRGASTQGFVRSLVRVLPHPENRLLRLEIDSEDYYRSSDIQLEGANAARNHSMDWSGLPAGTYKIVATVFGPDGERNREAVPFQVLGLTRTQNAPGSSPTVLSR
jgi:hypothetical protein